MVRQNRRMLSKTPRGVGGLVLSGAGRQGTGAARFRTGAVVSAVDAGMDTKRVSGPADPATTTRDIVVIKKVTVPVLASLTGTFTLTNVALEAALPACLGTYRIQKVSVYAPASVDSFVSLTDLTSDEAQFVDYGTQGSVRPQIHIRPSWMLRNHWYDKATAVSFYSALTLGVATAPGTQLIFQITVELRIPVP